MRWTVDRRAAHTCAGSVHSLSETLSLCRNVPAQLRRLLPWALLVVVAAVLGWLNYHAADDVQPVAGGLIVAGFGYALWRPRLAWLFVIVLWLSIPISGVVADAGNYHPGLVKPHPLYESLVALVPAGLGALAGMAVRWGVGEARAGS